MTTLSDLLRREHGFLCSDFGVPGDTVAVDSRMGCVHPFGNNDRRAALKDVFKFGQYVSLEWRGDGAEAIRFYVMSTGQDGLDVVSPRGVASFLPWEAIAAALRPSTSVLVHDLQAVDEDELENHELAFVRHEIDRLNVQVDEHGAGASALAEQIQRLQHMVSRPRLNCPSSWLGE